MSIGMKFKLLAVIALIASLGSIAVASTQTDDQAQEIIKLALANGGFSNVTTQIGDGLDKGGEKNLTVSYRSGSTDLMNDTGVILGVFLEAAKDWDVDSLNVTAVTSSNRTASTWYCTKEWKDAYLKGELNDTDIGIKVFGTMNTAGS